MKDIVGYEGIYGAEKNGKIWAFPDSQKRRWKDGRFLKPWLVGHGYEMVMLYKNREKPRKFLVHRLVAQSYIPNPSSLREVNHKNADRLDNRPQNLEWVSSKENKKHAWKLGLYEKNRGINHHLAKLNGRKVIQIRKLCEGGRFTQREIAMRFNVDQMTISNIKRRVVWKHIL